MGNIQEAFEEKKDLLTGKGIAEEQIASAEKELGLTFSEDYRTYLSLYGIAAYSGHELTGLSRSPRTNVVTVTKEAKENYTDIPDNFYVVEETGVEEIIIWQSSTGEIYCSSPNSPLKKIFNSMVEYIRK